MYYTYILLSKNLNKYYVDYTADIEARLIRHNQNSKGFTGKASDWIVVYTEIYHSKTDAYKREREIKAWKSRKMIERLISSEHPD